MDWEEFGELMNEIDVSTPDSEGLQLLHEQFKNREDLLNFVRDLVFIQGYAVSIKKIA